MLAARAAFVLSLGLAAGAALAQAEAPSSPVQPQAEEAPSQVVVAGKRPGPGLWKVAKDGHVMWVFGMYAPLPPKMEWDDSRVERLVAQSQEVLGPPSADVGVGWVGGFKVLVALPSLIGFKKNPDGAELREVLPADVYARWSVLKQKYMPDNGDVERERPFFAGQELLGAALWKNGLSNSIEVRKQIEALARKRGVKLTNPGFTVPLDDPGRLLKEFKQAQMDDTACFLKTLDTVESDIDAMRERANAWANGNIAEISKLDYAEREDACNDAILSSPAARSHPAFQNLKEKRLSSWLKAAERALADNTSTVAILPMSDILGAKSYLAVLQAKGYVVESPRQ